MGLDKFILQSPNISRLLSPETRKAERIATPEEARERAMARDEGVLQKEINSYLRLHGLEYICPPMHKRSMLPKAWPDHTTCYRGVAVAIESKVWGEKPRPDQAERHEAMRKSGWTVIVAYSVADVQKLFREIDAKKV